LIVDDETDRVHGLRRTLSMEIDCRVLTAGQLAFQVMQRLLKAPNLALLFGHIFNEFRKLFLCCP
jgi:hypothetical protein